jgi:hypothetical protein
MPTENFILKVDGKLKVDGRLKVLNYSAPEPVVNYNFRGDFTGIQYNLNDAVVSLGRNFETNMNSRALYVFKNITCAIGSSPYSQQYAHCWELITNLPDFNPADPLFDLPDNEAGVKMDGWYIGGVPVGGQSWRILNPTSLSNGRPAYTYGDETVLWNGSNWEYNNSGYGTLSTGTGNAPYPWQAVWVNGFTSEKSIVRS